MKRVVVVLVVVGVVLAAMAPVFAESQPANQFMVASALLTLTTFSKFPVMGGQICIQADQLEPPVLFVELGRWVEFLNRSGRLVRVVFGNRDSDAHPHYSVQTPDASWAVFLHAGTHYYTVHFLDPAMGDLEGRVVVLENAYGGQEDCDSITVHGGCLEP